MKEGAKNIKLISYPKSGSTYLKFILANLFFPDIEHDFSTVKKLIPTIDSPEMDNFNPVIPQFFKSHNEELFDKNSFIIVRHPGDTLISFYHHNRKFYNTDIPLLEYLENSKYGDGWRNFINKIKSYNINQEQLIRYEDLIKREYCIDIIGKITKKTFELFAFDKMKIIDHIGYYDIIRSIEKSSFKNMRQIEKTKGLGTDNQTNPGIFFIREGTYGQFKRLPTLIISKINYFNKNELKYLGYEI